MLTNGITAAEKQEILQRVLESKSFYRAPKLREFLRHVCERTLECELPVVREQDIGRVVYQRDEGYSPGEDNIVRVEARNLRRKLDQFFTEEGKDLPVMVRIPKGTYIPEFVRREPAAGQPPAQGLIPARLMRTAPAALALLALALAATSVLLWIDRRDLQARLQSSAPPTAAGPLWSALFDDSHVTYLVLADAGFLMAQESIQQRLTLSSYLQPGFGLAPGPNGPRTGAKRAAAANWPRHSSPTDAQLAARIGQLAAFSKGKLQVRFARDISARDLRGNHAILIGSVRSNPWVELFESKLNFRFEYDLSLSRPMVRNRSPRAGEESVYQAGGATGASAEIYAVAALVPNLTGDGRVLILSGTRREGTESAGELLANPERASRLLRGLQLAEQGRVHPFEILFKSFQVQGTSRAAEVVAWRRIPD